VTPASPLPIPFALSCHDEPLTTTSTLLPRPHQPAGDERSWLDRVIRTGRQEDSPRRGTATKGAFLSTHGDRCQSWSRVGRRHLAISCYVALRTLTMSGAARKGMLRRRAQCAALISVTCFALAGGGSPAESQAPSGYQPTTNFASMDATWSGTFKSTWPTASSTQYPRGIPGDTATVEITWSATVTATPDQFDEGLAGTESQPRVYWDYSELDGSYHYVNQEDKVDCTAQLSERPGYQSTTNDEALVTWHSDANEYEVDATTPFSFPALTTGLPQSDPCEAFAYWAEPPSTDTAFYQTFEQDHSVAPGGSPATYNRPLTTWDNPDEDATSSVSTDLTISLSTGPPCSCGCSTSASLSGDSFAAGSAGVFATDNTGQGSVGLRVYAMVSDPDERLPNAVQKLNAVLVATVTGGCPPYTFNWAAVLRPKFPPTGHSSYVSLQPTEATSTHNSNVDELNVNLGCAVPNKIVKANPHNPWFVCNGDVAFQVFVQDKTGKKGNSVALFLWKPQCLSLSYREGYKEELHDLGNELYGILGNELGHSGAEKFAEWLVEGIETPPLAGVLMTLQGEGKQLAIKWQNLRVILAEPNCPSPR
jgi:hypothetical protein